MELTTAFMACVFVLSIFILGFHLGWKSRCEVIRIHLEVEKYDGPLDDDPDIDERIRRSARDEFDEEDEPKR